ncbi:MAG: diaminopimelate decarboxylase [Muribaculaceae bacterium]|nr:diaminopimelate decarboxylase [Muribaculaceae bacterium]
MNNISSIRNLTEMETPYYFYDLDLLESTITQLKKAAGKYPAFKVHYAMKANCNPRLLQVIREAGLGADCVSGGEIKAAVAAGFSPDKIVFAGVGKTDKEIVTALQADIRCFNVESEPELEVISELALKHGFKARVALRVNPGIDAHTHRYITTGTDEDKFGIPQERLDRAIDLALSLPAIELVGLHFHIGSQLTDMVPYKLLCDHINSIQDKGMFFPIINVGGGLGVNYDNPDSDPIADFTSFFDLFGKELHVKEGQEIHFELGRSIVAQCGSLITSVVYVKEGKDRKFVIVDAGFNNLIRPALYQAYHEIENITSESSETGIYDVVGPICESTDIFGRNRRLPVTKRGDILAIRTAGAYGEIMASRYNMRDFAPSAFNR